MPGIFQPEYIDRIMDISQQEAKQTLRRLACEEGVFCGVSSGGAVAGALRLAQAHAGSKIVAIICDRGDRYLSTGVFSVR